MNRYASTPPTNKVQSRFPTVLSGRSILVKSERNVTRPVATLTRQSNGTVVRREDSGRTYTKKVVQYKEN